MGDDPQGASINNVITNAQTKIKSRKRVITVK